MSAALDIRAVSIIILERYLAIAEANEGQTARELIVSVNRDLDAMGCARTYAEYTLGPARLVLAHLEQMRGFIERARAGEVHADDLEAAAEAASSLMGDREEAA